jgi:hypothetical protein
VQAIAFTNPSAGVEDRPNPSLGRNSIVSDCLPFFTSMNQAPGDRTSSSRMRRYSFSGSLDCFARAREPS